ncbi:BrnT family toxin [Treponema primitia]|uniref:BrnT family toxin n=1 Tax=Treponema primitia TaxID=88058 RepID=UPI000255512E|nr:BrnT family toxin [Treponema primitia]
MGKTVISTDGLFEWDDDKSKINKELHGLYFAEILPAFDDPYILELYDETHSTVEETRYRGLAELQDFIILYLSYTEPGSGRTRIISVRPAEPAEERMYYEWRKNFNT